jgi:hypothetical protein
MIIHVNLDLKLGMGAKDRNRLKTSLMKPVNHSQSDLVIYLEHQKTYTFQGWTMTPNNRLKVAKDNNNKL